MIRHAFRNIRSKLQGPDHVPNVESESSQPQIPWGLPSEIVDIIFGHLSNLDRACFALTCKRLHDFYISYNRKYAISVLATLPGKELLQRLQNDRWVYCSICQNLHRHSRRKTLQFDKKCSPKPFKSTPILECMDVGHMQHLGQVDICPCSNITFHQKYHTNEYFQQKAKTSRSTFYFPKSGDLSHFCIFEHPQDLARVSIETKVEFNQNSGTFWVENQLTFQISKEKAELRVFQNMSSKLSRHDTEFWIKDFFREAQSDFFIGHDSSNWYQCHGWDHSNTKPGTFMILLNRNLGGTKGLDRAWERNCHY